MGTIGRLVTVLIGSAVLCATYSALDLRFGDRGFISWCAFLLLAIGLLGGTKLLIVSAGTMAAGLAWSLEPFTVLLLSCIVPFQLYSSIFPKPVDDTAVQFLPYEKKIKKLLFNTNNLHRVNVDAELAAAKGNEKELYRRYKRELSRQKLQPPGKASPDPMVPGNTRMSAVQLARERERDRVQGNIVKRVDELKRRTAR